MYCVFLGRAVGTVNAPAGSVTTSQIAADAVNGDKIADDSISDEHLDPTAITGQTAEATIASDDLILLSDTSASGALKKMTRANFVSGVGGVNTPAFQAKLTTVSTTFSEGSLTTLIMNSEDFDTDSAYDTSNGQFTPQTAGKYFCEVFVHADRGGSTMSDLKMAYVQLFKNSSGSGGKAIQQMDMRNNYGRGFGVNVSAIFDLNGSSDYVYPVLSIQTNSGSDPVFVGESSYTYFRAFKLIGV